MKYWLIISFLTLLRLGTMNALSTPSCRRPSSTPPLKKKMVAPLLSKISTSNRKTATNLKSKPSGYLNWTLACVTWNLQEMTPSMRDCKFLQSFTNKDLVVIGAQECENLKPRRNEGSRSLALRRKLKATLGLTHALRGTHKMGGLQIFLYAKETVMDEVQGLQMIGVPCGVGNVWTNKGAVCVLLRAKDRTFAFVNAHLAAHEEMLGERNANYHRIRNSILSRADGLFLSSSYRLQKISTTVGQGLARSRLALTSPGSKSRFYLDKILTASGYPRDKLFVPIVIDDNAMRKSPQELPSPFNHRQRPISRKTSKTSFREIDTHDWPFDAVFFFGDLNYRINGLSRADMDKFVRHARIPNNKNRDKLKKLSYFSKLRRGMRVRKKSSQLLENILVFDQLKDEIHGGRAFSKFEEGKITFLPTYKYDLGTSRLDSSEKKRCPGWTDRVLFRSYKCTTSKGGRSLKANIEAISNVPLSIQLEKYDSFDVRCSDHRPVTATFVLKIPAKTCLPHK